MAPIKFEENIREKLQERELQPSKEAWNQLASKLESEPERKSNNFLWMAVAASLVGILLVISFLFNERDGEATNQIVVDETASPENEKILIEEPNMDDIIVENTAEGVAKTNSLKEVENSSERAVPKTIGIRKINEAEIANAPKTNGKKPIENSVFNSEEKVPPIRESKIEEGIATNKNSLEKVVQEDPLKPMEDSFTNMKVDEVVATIQDIQKENNTVTAEEIDALLAKAQRDIATNRILNSSTRKVDATALLLDVETEMERSFRDKVFEALGEGYNKVRTAVAERNN